MRIITIDAGNSNPNVGIFENGILSKNILYQDYVFQKNDIRLLSSVNSNLNIECEFNLAHFRKNNFFFEMPIHYSETLGIDRIIAAYSSYSLLKEEKAPLKSIVIDAGTFMTIDTVSSNLGFEGGYIFPGINLFLNTYTKGSQLPELQYREIDSSELPQNTEEAILFAGHLYLKNILESTIKKTSPHNIVITGGSSEKIYHLIKKFSLEIELQLSPQLLHQAMYSIYLHHLTRP